MRFLPQRLHAFFRSSFFKGSFIYLSGSVLNAALPLATLPILTKGGYLTEVDYGVMSTGTVLTQILVIIMSLNAYGLFARVHFDDQPEEMRALVSTGTALSLLVAGVFLGLVLLLGGPLAHFATFPQAWLPAILLIALGIVIQGNYQALLQVRNEPFRYIALQTLGGVLNVGLSLWLVISWHMDWRGRMWALLISQAALALVCLWGLTSRLRLLHCTFTRSAYRQIVNFGLPLIPHVLGGWVMTMVARLYLNRLTGDVAETGLYGIAFNLTSPLMMIIGAANSAYIPTIYQHLSRKDDWDRVRLCRVLLLACLALPLLALVCAAGVRWVLPLLVGPRFYGAASYVTWMALTAAVQGIYFIFGNFVVYSKKTSLMTWRADFLGGVVLVIACPLLIRWNGPIGAAQATCLAVAASTIGCITAARKAYPMPWRQALLTFR